MAFSIRKYLSNLYLSVAVEGNKCLVYGKVIKNGQVLRVIENSFECGEENIDIKFNEYIRKLENSAYFAYISILIHGPKQFAIPVCDSEGFAKFGLKYDLCRLVNVNEEWSIATYKSQIAQLIKFLNGLEPNLIYSPFSLLYEQILASGVPKLCTMYLYSQTDYVFVMVFKDQKMKFATCISMKHFENIIASSNDFKDFDIADIDNVIVSEENNLFNLAPLETSGDDMGNLSDLDSDEYMNLDQAIEHSVSNISKETTLLENMRQSIKEFYSSKLYEGDFIEQIVFYDGINLDSDFESMVASEIMIPFTLKQIDTVKSMNEIMIRDLNES